MNHKTIKKGMMVDYHSIIGGPVTKANCEVTIEPYDMAAGLRRKLWVCHIDGIRGCVSVEALTKAKIIKVVEKT